MTDDLERYLESLQREDRYIVDEVLKQSAFEVTQRVHLSQDESSGFGRGPFIRKFIKREKGLGSAYERIYTAQAAGRSFKHVPAIHECYAHDDDLVVVMQFVEGQTLQDLVYAKDPSVELAKVVFPQVCDAVAELHTAFDPPIIHRDLKPSNVMVSFSGGKENGGVMAGAATEVPMARPSTTSLVEGCNVTVIDFGIAREFRANAEADTVHFGTRDFAPPEQFGYGQTSESSDVYALGLLLFFCLTETIPTPAVRQEGFADPRVPEDMRRLIVQATSFDPARRFNSAMALKHAFESVVCGAQPVKAYSSTGINAPMASLAGTPLGHVATQTPVADEGINADAQEILQAQTGSDASAEPLQIVGRVWNVAVVAFAAFILVYMTYFALTSGLQSPDGVTYSPAGTAVSYVLGVGLTALLCLACLDKRRLKNRVPLFVRLRTWQLWVLFALLYLITTLVRGLLT